MKKYLIAVFTLGLFATLGSCGKSADKPKEETFTKYPAPTTWKADQTGKYPVSMTAVVKLPQNVLADMQAGDQLGAFIKDECRGTGVIVQVDTANVFYILIHGTAAEQDKIRFKYYSTKTQYMYITTENVNFAMDGNYGTADKPEVLELYGIK